MHGSPRQLGEPTSLGFEALERQAVETATSHHLPPDPVNLAKRTQERGDKGFLGRALTHVEITE